MSRFLRWEGTIEVQEEVERGRITEKDGVSTWDWRALTFSVAASKGVQAGRTVEVLSCVHNLRASSTVVPRHCCGLWSRIVCRPPPYHAALALPTSVHS